MDVLLVVLGILICMWGAYEIGRTAECIEWVNRQLRNDDDE